MRVYIALSLTVLILSDCHRAHSTTHLTSEDVLKRLKIAYALEDRGNLVGADSIYSDLLAHSVAWADSVNISASYLSVLRKKGDFEGMLFHTNRAFPKNSASPRDQLRRSSYRMDAFLSLRFCDSTRIELEKLFALVERDSTLQLSIANLLHNREVVDSICGLRNAIHQ